MMSQNPQAFKVQEVTKHEALVLMKNMLRISVSTICYMRDIFPIDCYKNKQYGSVEIHQLQGASKNLSTGEVVIYHPEAFLVTQWLEKGVFAALENEYLAAMTFAIFGKHPHTGCDRLLESYEFKISYEDEQRTCKFKINDIEIQSKETVKAQAAQFIRSLTEFVATLDTIPQERWITIQLKYRSLAPTDYEPEYFCGSATSLFEGHTTPLVVNVGHLSTSNITMKLKYAGLESLFEEDQAVTTDEMVRPKMLIASTNEEETVLDQGNIGEGTGDYRTRIVNHINVHKCTIMAQCSAELGINMKDVRSVFQQLERDGILARKGRTFVLTESEEVPDVTTMNVQPENTHSMEHESLPMASQCSDAESSKRARRYSIIKDPILLEQSAKRIRN